LRGSNLSIDYRTIADHTCGVDAVRNVRPSSHLLKSSFLTICHEKTTENENCLLKDYNPLSGQYTISWCLHHKDLDVCKTAKLRKAENSGLQDVAIFCRHCMLKLVLSASAPSGDLQFLKYLNKYKIVNEKVATAASRTLLVTFCALV